VSTAAGPPRVIPYSIAIGALVGRSSSRRFRALFNASVVVPTFRGQRLLATRSTGTRTGVTRGQLSAATLTKGYARIRTVSVGVRDAEFIDETLSLGR